MYRLTVNHTQLCHLFKRSTQIVTKYRKLGLPTIEGGGSGKATLYDVSDAIEWLVQWEIGKHKKPGDEDAEAAEAARLKRAQADERELRVAHLRGETIPLSDAVSSWSSIVSAARTRFLGLPSKLKSRYPDMPREAVDELDELVREILEELATHDPDELARVTPARVPRMGATA